MNASKAGVVLNCRTCTRACKQYKSLQEEIEIGPEGTTTLANMLHYCTSLSFEPQNGAAMPQHICLHCLQLLEQSFNFKRMVIDSDELLRLGLEEIETNPDGEMNANDSNQEYVMIEVLANQAESLSLAKTNSAHQDEEFFESYSEQDTEQEDDYVIDEAQDVEADADTETETDDAVETLNSYQPANIEYVTFKSEYDSQIDEEDDIEVMDSPRFEAVGEQMEMQLLDEHMVILTAEEQIDEVIAEIDADDILEIEREEHLLPGDSDGSEYFLEDSMDESAQNQIVAGPSGDVLPHVCHVCKKAFRQLCRLNQHMRSHVDEKLYSCEVCGKKLKHLRNYKEHMLTHTNVKPHQCVVCSRFYRTTSSLAAHMRTHAEDKPYKCDQCGRSYAAFDHLRRHRLTHTGERPYGCDLCDKAYYDSSSLRQHKISHTGEKAFTCEICGVGLSQKSGYKKHMLVHSGEKPHKCNICGRAFTFTSNLNAHVRLHSGEKPFKCDKCMKAFPTKKRLNSHMRVHNKEAPVTTTSNAINTNSTTTTSSLMSGVAAGRRSAMNMPDITDQQVSTSKVVVVL